MKYVLHCKKGFTLIELLVTIFVSTILLTMLASLFYSFQVLYQQLETQNQIINDLSMVKAILNQVIDENDTFDFVVEDVGKDIVFDKNDTQETDYRLSVLEGKIILNDIVLTTSSYIEDIDVTTNGIVLQFRIFYKLNQNQEERNSYQFVKVLRSH